MTEDDKNKERGGENVDVGGKMPKSFKFVKFKTGSKPSRKRTRTMGLIRFSCLE